ncbi:F-box protein [Rhizoctonia solani AG-3 Rhs1AP]|uniref:F-box protein n=1 Tax=Rhizoctonia solani AG-3 Rhs1AP TaxID=1086054 RepID=X8J5H8_9AGAM|nr:F-box protein [Rhizoctonia solani AG-3 Rhs1AP]
MIPNTSNSLYPISMCSMPNEVIALVASQLILSFKDVIAFSATSRRIHEATSFLVTKPLLVEDLHGTTGLNREANPTFGLSRASVVNVKFATGDTRIQSEQSEQLRCLLARAPRLRYLALHRPALPIDKKEPPVRWEPTRSKTSAYPFPLRTSHFPTKGSYLSKLTHLDLSGLSIHPMIFSRLSNLTHLKLSLCSHQDAYFPSEVLSIITFAKACKLVAFEIGMHVMADQRERLNVVRACVEAWPSLKILDLVSADREGKALSLGDSWLKSENVVNSAIELASTLSLCPDLTTLLLGLSSNNAESLAAIFHQYCPLLELFGCLTPSKIKPGNRRPFVESFELVVARRSKQDEWLHIKDISGRGDIGIFGMFE